MPVAERIPFRRAPRPAEAASRAAHPWIAVVVISSSLLMIGLDNTILNVALPAVQRSLSSTASGLQWTIDAYLLVFAGMLLAAGNLGDRIGRRRVLQVGLVVFATGSALAAASGTTGELIASRALMGLGGALIMPSTLSIITAMFSGPARTRAIAVWTAVAGLGVALGPVTGGWLLQRYWWGSVFLVNVPLAAITLLAGFFLIPESRDPDAGRADPLGALLATTGLLALVYGIIEAPAKGWTGTVTIAAFVSAAVLLSGFAAWQLHTDHPMVQLRFFGNRRFSAASATIALAFFGLFGALFFLTQYMQLVLGYDALQAGIRTTPVAAGMIVGSALSAPANTRAGTKVSVALGMLLTAAGLAALVGATPTSGYPRVLTALVLAGTGIGLAMAPATDSVMGSLPLAKASIGSAMNDTARLVGGAIGVAVLGTLLNQVYRSHIAPAAAALPGPMRGPATDSLQAALATSSHLPTAAAIRLQEASRLAFTDAMGQAALTAAVIAIAAAAVALLFLPSHDHANANQ